MEPRASIEEGKKVTRFLITGIDDLNRKAVAGAGRSTVSMIKRELRKKYNIRLSDLDQVMSTKAGGLVYEIRLAQKALPGVLFKPREIRNGSSVYSVKKRKKSGEMDMVRAKLQKRYKGKATGVTIEYQKGVTEHVEPGGRGFKGFIAKTPGRGIQVFYRRDENREKIFTFYKGSVAGIVASTVSLGQIGDHFGDKYRAEVERLLPHLGTSQQ